MLPAVLVALRQDGWDPELEYCSHVESYYELMLRLWRKAEDFCVIEHDVVVFPGALSEMESCTEGEGWCTRPYYCSVGWINDGLGCTKFSARFIEKYPDFLSEPFPDCCQHTRHYCGLDRLMAHRAEQLGIKPHIHYPGVSNLNDRWT
jgi:hypothetical protein